MIDVYVATFYSRNYGSALQAYALQEVIKQTGHTPCVIREVNHDEGRSKLYLLIRSIKRFIWQFKPEHHYGLIKKIKLYRDRSVFEDKNQKIEKFCEDNIRFFDIDLSTDVFSPGNINPCIIAGSDQIWNIIDRKITPFYLLSFANDEKIKKNSYAASVGIEKLSKEQVEYYTNALEDFEHISFREKSTLRYFVGTQLEKRIRQDMDPTLLLDGEFWSKIAANRLVDFKYIYVYMLRPNDVLIAMARVLQEKYGYKIIVSSLMNYKIKDVITRNDAGVEEFLSLIKNAEFVVTNSFHGTCFSTQFHKPFVSVRVQSTGTRAKDFLEEVGLEDRLISDISDISIIEEDIDYIKVDHLLNKKREKSKDYLQGLLNRE